MRWLTTKLGRGRKPRRGFTLIETAMAMVIIGIAIGATLQLLAAGTQCNIAGTELTTAVNLAKNIREVAGTLAFQDPNNPTSPTTQKGNLVAANDIWDLDTVSQSPPVDCNRTTINQYVNWRQNVSVQTVWPAQLSSTRPNDPTSPTARITVTILHGGNAVYQTSWLVCMPNTGT
jgi:prepilin-type N-terminal cleavage/methylation domain-containing protein